MIERLRRASVGWLPIIAIFVGFFVFLLGQTISGIIVVAQLSTRVEQLEKKEREQDARITAIDEQGSRKLLVIDERQQQVLKTLDSNARNLDANGRRMELIMESLGKMREEFLRSHPGGQDR